jgi:hypothetical protein
MICETCSDYGSNVKATRFLLYFENSLIPLCDKCYKIRFVSSLTVHKYVLLTYEEVLIREVMKS